MAYWNGFICALGTIAALLQFAWLELQENTEFCRKFLAWAYRKLAYLNKNMAIKEGLNNKRCN